MRLPWLAHNEAPGPYITIPQYRFNKTKQHTPVFGAGLSRITWFLTYRKSAAIPVFEGRENDYGNK